MKTADELHIIVAVRAIGPASLHLAWSDGTEADLDLSVAIEGRAFAALRDSAEFAKVAIGEWGHSLAWPAGAELGADMLRHETLLANAAEDAELNMVPDARNGGEIVSMAPANFKRRTT